MWNNVKHSHSSGDRAPEPSTSAASNAFLRSNKSDICKLVKFDSFLLCVLLFRSRPNELLLSCSAKNGLWVIIRSAISESTSGDALNPAVAEDAAPGAGEDVEP